MGKLVFLYRICTDRKLSSALLTPVLSDCIRTRFLAMEARAAKFEDPSGKDSCTLNPKPLYSFWDVSFQQTLTPEVSRFFGLRLGDSKPEAGFTLKHSEYRSRSIYPYCLYCTILGVPYSIYSIMGPKTLF